jgi:hypothetical protein
MSSVTLYISGHGKEEPNIPVTDMNNVTLLSFCGLIGTPGKMPLCTDKRGKKGPIDITTFKEILRPIYREEIKYGTDQISILKSLTNTLRNFYETKCGIKFQQGGFKITQPLNERRFQLRPGRHENCISCVKRDDPECIEETERRKQYCPEYGIVVIASTDDRDDGFTLVTNTERDTEKSNLSMQPLTFEHWYNKAQNYGKRTIRQNMLVDKEITLTELVNFFASMGFANINILDPTCRHLDTSLKDSKDKLLYRTTKSWIEQNKFNNREQDPLLVNVVKQAVLAEQDKGILKYVNGKTILCLAGVCMVVALVSKFAGGEKHKRNKRCRTHKNCKTHKIR